ncbi:MAG: tetraacyldisaccharide 4'-kinase [Burkholderiales bacterium]
MNWLERHWQRVTLLGFFLYPLSLFFLLAVKLRRALYRAGILPAARLPVAVVVVGNITVGGTGKTPLVLWLVNFLREHGLRPGIVSRGYGRRGASPRAVTAASDVASCGDEPVMLAQRANVPVWVGADRVAAARALLQAHPECDVIVSDDGLQHYALQRDLEIAVIDGARGLGNARLLPAGPLREPATRLAAVDAIVVNVSQSAGVGLRTGAPPAFAMTLQSRGFYNLLNPDHKAVAEQFMNRRVHAIAGIGNPRRFFELLQRLGLTFTAHPFPDHHAFSAGELACDDADFVVMTEKDAVKCRPFATEKHWVLRVEAEIDPAFGELVLKKLGK